ncbi:ion transporter [Pseudohongiella sp. SYSU M77423]|uniref:ion transporter n=1 Tax=Pseudohongiella sp. SYSU M77423 TaxID=3042312 RepID=UPI000C351B29|nr:ion transporter [Pseudohongiella sp. SYSU M77423]MAY55429.1 voltage-gated sodium channel [Gammaproteobacteria bacterium]MBJ55787.1 voltage-gated sodium channel [Gammaproteobacteria bacterium]MDH7942765.1 ion transporter [Pseudohongiella sp. SYSU M77423]HBN14856.1 voltage-gated sodium channel [Pseudohongiella sp.]|tara:strand:+ start:4677 stop:5513 length:837 start_codon:yes stop_codon:yes gene_type:complete
MKQSFRQRVERWIESSIVQNFIIGVIIFNAITLGLETSASVMRIAGEPLRIIEQLVLAIFVTEIALKLYAYGHRFFRSGWNVFDIVIVGIALLPATGPLAILRALRILRVLRLLTKIDRLRRIIESLLRAIPSIGWILFLLSMVFYIFGVMGTQLFAERFPEDFGTLGRTLYTLFQVMTLESWSEGVSRPVMAIYPYAWMFFISFVLITAFVVLNLFIGIIVSTMQESHYEEENRRRDEKENAAHAEREEMLVLIRELNDKVDRLQASIPQPSRTSSE